MERSSQRYRMQGFADNLEPGLYYLFDKLQVLLPDWLDSLNVVYSETPLDLEGDVKVKAAVASQKPYRLATLWIYPLFLGMSGQEQFHTLVHELAHLPLMRYHLIMGGLVKDLAGEECDSLLHKTLMRMVNDECEASTEDVARIYLRLLES